MKSPTFDELLARATKLHDAVVNVSTHAAIYLIVDAFIDVRHEAQVETMNEVERAFATVRAPERALTPSDVPPSTESTPPPLTRVK